MTAIISHTNQLNAMLKLLNSDNLSHSIMLVGSAGIGKSLVARTLAHAIVCEGSKPFSSLKGCGSCKHCLMFGAGTHPDIYFVEGQEKENNTVLYVRELLAKLQLKSFAGGARVVVFNDAERLSLQALNALLKTLEEPLPNTYFILIVSNSAQMPATILSRCQKWFFGSLKNDEVAQIIEDKFGVAGEQLTQLAEIASGSLANIEGQMNNISKYSDFARMLDGVLKGDIKSAVDLASEVHSDKENHASSLEMLISIVATNVRNQSDTHKRNLLANLLDELILAERYITERNLNSFYLLQVVFENFILALHGRAKSSLQSMLI